MMQLQCVSETGKGKLTMGYTKCLTWISSEMVAFFYSMPRGKHMQMFHEYVKCPSDCEIGEPQTTGNTVVYSDKR